MRWLTVSFLLYLARLNDAGAIKCHPGSQDPVCVTEEKEILPARTLSLRDASKACAPGSEWERDCLRCRCSAEGLAECTRLESCENGGANAAECVPGTTVKIDCNTCHCMSSGRLACTKKGCLTLNFSDRSKRSPSETNTALHTLTRKSRGTPEPAKMCQPGQEFRMDCNKCLCNDEGQDFSCTRIDCAALGNNGGVETRRKRDLTEQIEMKCVPGSVFNRECNACRCTDDGEHASCSNKRCQKEKEPEPANTESSPSFRCTPGDQFKRGCKDCTCSADGKNVFCTLRLCDQDLVDKL